MAVTLNKQEVSPPPAHDVDYILDVGAHNFVAEILEGSHKNLVLVNCWAPWCGPCKQIGAALEKIVLGTKGAIRLAKVNIDEAPQLAVEMHIQSIPAVLAFYQGQLVDGFMGALPDLQIKDWLDRLIKAIGAPVSNGDAEPTIDDLLREADQYLTDDNIVDAQRVYADILKQDPKEGRAFAGALRCLVSLGNPDLAADILEKALPELRHHKAVDAVRSAIDLARESRDVPAQFEALTEKVSAEPQNHQARYDLAMAYFAARRADDALNELLEIVQRDRKWHNEAARKQLVKLFDVLGPTDPLTISARKRLSSILFS